MRRDQAIALLLAHRADLHRFAVKSLVLFDSVARDEAGPQSDIDVLVEFEGPPTFRGYMGLVAFLEDLFGCKVYVVTPAGIKPRARPFIDRDLVHVA